MNQNNTGYHGNMVSTQAILTTNFVKYTRLNDLIQFAFAGSDAENLNIYIDLYGVVKTLFSDSLRTDISDYTSMTSTIINMCGHYRFFFRAIGVETKIFLIFSYNCPETNRKFVSGYNRSFFGKKDNRIIKEMVDLNNQLLELLCPYLPDIHFLKTDFESSVLMNYLIMTEYNKGNKNPNLVISKDLYPCQLTYYHPNTAYIKPKKIRGEDVSRITPGNNHEKYISEFWRMVASCRNISLPDNLIHPCLFPIFSAMTRFPERSLESVVSIPRAFKILYDISRQDPIPVLPRILETHAMECGINLPLNTIEGRWKSIDLSFQTMLYESSMEAKMIHYENLSDVGTINHICSKYFSNNPIDLGRL